MAPGDSIAALHLRRRARAVADAMPCGHDELSGWHSFSLASWPPTQWQRDVLDSDALMLPRRSAPWDLPLRATRAFK